MSQKLRGAGPCISVLTSLPGDSDACSSLRTTALETAFPPGKPGVVDRAVGPVSSLLFNKIKPPQPRRGPTVGDMQALLGLVTCFGPWDLADVMPAEA